MTNKQIKDLVLASQVDADLQPLRDFEIQLKKKIHIVNAILRAMEMKVQSLAEIEKIKDLTV